MLIVHTGKPYTIEYLMALLKFDSANQFRLVFDPTAPADIVLAIGDDWSNPIRCRRHVLPVFYLRVIPG